MKWNRLLCALLITGLLFSAIGEVLAWDGVTTAVSNYAPTGQVSITQTATKIIDGGQGRFSLTLRNTGANSCWIGMVGVSTTTGFVLLAGEPITLDRAADATWYAITAAGTNTTISFLAE